MASSATQDSEVITFCKRSDSGKSVLSKEAVRKNRKRKEKSLSRFFRLLLYTPSDHYPNPSCLGSNRFCGFFCTLASEEFFFQALAPSFAQPD